MQDDTTTGRREPTPPNVTSIADYLSRRPRPRPTLNPAADAGAQVRTVEIATDELREAEGIERGDRCDVLVGVRLASGALVAIQTKRLRTRGPQLHVGRCIYHSPGWGVQVRLGGEWHNFRNYEIDFAGPVARVERAGRTLLDAAALAPRYDHAGTAAALARMDEDEKDRTDTRTCRRYVTRMLKEAGVSPRPFQAGRVSMSDAYLAAVNALVRKTGSDESAPGDALRRITDRRSRFERRKADGGGDRIGALRNFLDNLPDDPLYESLRFKVEKKIERLERERDKPDPDDWTGFDLLDA